MKYMFVLYGTGRPLPEPGTEEHRQMVEAWDVANTAMTKAGVRLTGRWKCGRWCR